MSHATKICPKCDRHTHIARKVCPICGYEFRAQVVNSTVSRLNEPYKIGLILHEINRLKLARTKIDNLILKKEILIQETIKAHFDNAS
ncbi:DNA-directed RNA polymerase [Caudoviricetes sp.]|nr:DNA-directed RNA polymerase [Caudoviricetes sp.]